MIAVRTSIRFARLRWRLCRHSPGLLSAGLLGMGLAGAEPPTQPGTHPIPARETSAKVGQWVALFDGRTLEGWEQHSGKAEYRVDDHCIVGKTVAGTGNSFLCTRRPYADFEFEFEFNVAPDMNSGVQFRSEFYPQDTFKEIDGKQRKFSVDRVHGYQFEIDPSARAYTGGIYDEGRRGWLVELKTNLPARLAFKPGDWNQGRIKCQGDRLQTWINGVPAADFNDSMTLRGLIALQVHGIGDGTRRKPGGEIRWRKLRLKEL